MKLQESEFSNWSDSSLPETLKPGLVRLMDGLRYDSLSTYLYLADGSEPEDTLDRLLNIDLRGLIEYKNGQDCYDILFELLASIPEDLSPQIVGCPNDVHTTPAQLEAAPYLHVAMTVTDPRDGLVYLLDPGKWITSPILLSAGTSALADDGNICTVITAESDKYELDEHKVLRNRHDRLLYERVPDSFSIDRNLIGYMRLRERYNCISSVVTNQEPPYYLKFLFDSGDFAARLPDGQRVMSPEEIGANSSQVDEIFGETGFSARVQRFAQVFRELPEEFWV